MTTDMEFPEAPDEFTEEKLDFLPLKFGKFKGRTPNWVAENDPNPRGNWLVWAFENVGGFDVCSFALYRDVGGKGDRSIRAQPENSYQKRSRKDIVFFQEDWPSGEMTKEEVKKQAQERYESRASKPATGHIDDMDDDIPF